ncbi:glycoside hydrolase family 6 protein [Nocardioides sp.]|uniref:glycoside hydrolase family 6 protein n=1 Tax=Nocardioides sp. TaxID=35761 RepID=UPI0039E2BB88
MIDLPAHRAAALRPRRGVAALAAGSLVVLVALLVTGAWALGWLGESKADSATEPSSAPTASTVAPVTGRYGPKVVTPGGAPKIGAAVAGQTVTVKIPKNWDPDTRFSYQWLVDGKPVAGATKRRFTPTVRHIGKKISVQVTGREAGYAPASRVSRARVVKSDNPLDGGPWAVYRGEWNGIYPAYQAASGDNKAQLAKIALQPRVIWFAANWPTSRIREAISGFIAEQQAEFGDDALIQLAIFREWPREESGRGKPLSGAEQADYRAWIDQAAAAIGDARVALILEPDLGLNAIPNNSWELRTADPAVRLSLVRYAAQKLSALPRTSVYLDASDADWLSLAKIVPVLEAAGVEYVRGIALGATHYSSVPDNIDYGKQIIDALEADGITGKHMVIDTADNGRPFTWLQHRAEHPGADFDNAATCRSVSDTTCDTLGVPPTTDVTGEPGLGLSEQQQRLALRYVDAYLWFGRPWLIRQASPFSLARSLEVARSTPYQ